MVFVRLKEDFKCFLCFNKYYLVLINKKSSNTSTINTSTINTSTINTSNY